MQDAPKPKLLATGIAVATILLLGSLRTWDLYRLRSQRLSEAEAQAGRRAIVAAQFLRESFRAVDVGLRELVVLAPRDVAAAEYESRWDQILDAFQPNLGVGSLSMVDSAGTIRFSTLRKIVGQSRAKEYLFRQLSSQPLDSLVVDTPFRSLVGAHDYLLPLGRRLAGADGQFRGAVVATFLPSRLREVFRTMDVGTRGAIWVLHPDGIVLYREPSSANPIGDTALAPALADRIRSNAAVQVGRVQLEPGGGDYILAWQPLDDPRLFVAVSLSEQEILADWAHECVVSAWAFGVALFFVLIALQVLFREVRSRNLAEQARVELGESHRDLQDYVDGMSTLTAKIAPDGRLLLVNAIAARAWQLDRNALADTNFLDGPWWSFDPRTQARVRQAFARARSGETVTYSERILAFGRVLDVDFSLIPVKDSLGDVSYLIAEARDVSDLQRSERELAARTVALEATNRELETFSYSVSHDLRAPLRSIAGFARVLQEDHGGRLDDEGLRLLNRIVESGTMMGRLIDDLLDFSQNSRRAIEPQRIDMTELTRSAFSEAQSSEPHRQIEFRVDELPDVVGDPAMLRQAWLNLLGNAIKYTRRQAHAVIEVSGSTDGHEARFVVRDNGVGYDTRYEHKLFGVFQRLHKASEFEGTGVGLAMVRRIIERHGGRIWSSSVLGQGSVFEFTLPSKEDSHDRH